MAKILGTHLRLRLLNLRKIVKEFKYVGIPHMLLSQDVLSLTGACVKREIKFKYLVAPSNFGSVSGMSTFTRKSKSRTFGNRASYVTLSSEELRRNAELPPLSIADAEALYLSMRRPACILPFFAKPLLHMAPFPEDIVLHIATYIFGNYQRRQIQYRAQIVAVERFNFRAP